MMDKLSIVGLGEVGLLFAALFDGAPDIQLVGVDKSPGQRGAISSGQQVRGRAYTIPIFAVDADVEPADIHVICVDTPLDPMHQTADLTNIEDATKAVGRVLRRGDTVILRSTVPVGTTTNLVAPILKRASGLDNHEFHLATAPERSRTGGTLEEAKLLKHLIGARTDESAAHVEKIFARAGLRTERVENTEAAELGKLASNAARDVTQAVANTVAQVCTDYGLDARRLIDSINADYPRDRLKNPTPGIGGSCLTKDPYFLAQALRTQEHHDLLRTREQ